MKILFVSNLFPDAGEPTRGRENAELLRQLAKQAEVRVVAIRQSLTASATAQYRMLPQDAILQPQYVRVPYVPKLGTVVAHRLYARSLAPVIRELVETWKPDVVIGGWLYPDACAVSRVCRGLNVPMVALTEGSDARGYLDNPRRRRLIVDMIDNRAAAVITRTEEMAERLFNSGIETKQIYTIPNGIDHTVFRPAADRTALRKKLRLPKAAPVVLFVGKFLPEKDPATLASGFEIVAHAFPDAILALCGDGPLRRQMVEDLDRADLLEHCRFEGMVSPEIVAAWMQAADLLVVSDRYETTSTVILEAFCCGSPVVATAVGGVPDIIVDSGLGRVVPPRDPDSLATAIAAVLQNPPDRELIAEHAEGFHWDTTINDLLGVVSNTI